ncbi:hypothetical protein [Nonomuraea sp. SBT364]|uniref:hypothetical protein n=1 Tax=Nonomuraea sp. SBT364 TaxID=1580530 RepID=UPI00066DCA4D|nr:hypothetical protein [Nonomuraea sp. SBT364]
MTGRLAAAVEAITDALHARNLDKARTLFDEAVHGRQELVEPLVRRLAATVTVPAGMVVWGFGLDIWANPYRDPDETAWRCGGCRMTASHYKTDRAARRSAEKHVAEVHGGRLAVVSYLDEAYWAAVEAAS